MPDLMDLRPRIVLRHPTFGAHVIDPLAGGGGPLPAPFNEVTYEVVFGEPDVAAGELVTTRLKTLGIGVLILVGAVVLARWG